MALHTEHPPGQALMIFDGDCGFCRYWIQHWQWITGEALEHAPAQEVAQNFPDIPREAFAESVRLIEPDGAVYGGAEAVARALAKAPGRGGYLWAYRHVPGVAAAGEMAYRFIARRRNGAMRITSWLWGRTPRRGSAFVTRWVFLRMLGCVFLAAFLSLLVQVQGLIGSNGIAPAARLMTGLRSAELTPHWAWARYWFYPTLCWITSSDAFLNFLCAGGVVCAVVLIFNIAPALMLLLLWIFYLSLSAVGGVFLEFQWDALLLETGFLAIFLAPWEWRPRLGREGAPSAGVVWLLRLLLFRLMFSSGMVKVLSDEAWRDLSALDYHFMTQPLPTWIGWWMHQLPRGMHHALTFLTLFIEIAVPFLILTPRRPRLMAFVLLMLLQIIIMLTGNYAFFNWLTIALCVMLLDDGYLRKLRRVNFIATARRRPKVQSALLGIAGMYILFFSVLMMVELFERHGDLPDWISEALEIGMPLRLVNSYGLFAVMTRTRAEIEIEGSNDGINWQTYEFRWKPGDIHQRPVFVAPLQPRLDWQMWFAALGTYEQNPWLQQCMMRLLRGSPEVLKLFKKNPFPAAPPKMMRAMLYDYQFTTAHELRTTGAWWKRMPMGAYTPVFGLRG